MIFLKKYLIIFFIAIFISIPANSVLMLGNGASSCGEMISQDKGDNDYIKIGNRAWILGYVSAMNELYNE